MADPRIIAIELDDDTFPTRAIDVDAQGTYPQATTYRRALVMVDAGATGSYYVDFFDVEGGRQHDCVFHGPPGAFGMQGGAWTAPEGGTLAGENVPVGVIYDDPKMGKSGYKNGFNSYAGSGFQHVYAVQRQTDDTPWVAEWHHAKDAAARVRIRTLSEPGQQMLTGKAHVSPVKFPEEIQLLIARRQAVSDTPLKSRFVSVIEPYKGDAFIASCTAVPLTAGSGTAVEVKRTGGETDLIMHDPAQSKKALGEITSDAHSAVITRDAGGKVRRVFFAGGTFLTIGGQTWRGATLTGTVAAVDPQKRTVTVRLDGDNKEPADIDGRIAHFTNALRQTTHPVLSSRRDGNLLTLTTKDDLLVGRLPVKSVSGNTITSAVNLPLAPTYIGASLCGVDFADGQTVQAADTTTVTLRAAHKSAAPGKDLWVVNIAPGDRFEIPAHFATTMES